MRNFPSPHLTAVSRGKGKNWWDYWAESLVTPLHSENSAKCLPVLQPPPQRGSLALRGIKQYFRSLFAFELPCVYLQYRFLLYLVPKLFFRFFLPKLDRLGIFKSYWRSMFLQLLLLPGTYTRKFGRYWVQSFSPNTFSISHSFGLCEYYHLCKSQSHEIFFAF